MPVEFLTNEQAAGYGRFTGSMTWAELERFFFLVDADLRLVVKRRGDHNRLGLGLQLATVRALGMFLVDPLDVPPEAVDYVAMQVHAPDPSCSKAYAEQEKTRLEHQWEITREYGYSDFAAALTELARWIDDRAWTTGDGPKALFDRPVAWLRDRRVLLPGVSVLARLVARVRDEATRRLYDTLAGQLTAAQAGELLRTLEVPDRARVSRVSRAELRAAVVSVTRRAAPRRTPHRDGEWRAALVERFASVRGFVPLLAQ